MSPLNKRLVCWSRSVGSWFPTCLIDCLCSFWVWRAPQLESCDSLAIHNDGLKVTARVKVLSSQLASGFHKYSVARVIYQKCEPRDLDVWGWQLLDTLVREITHRRLGIRRSLIFFHPCDWKLGIRKGLHGRFCCSSTRKRFGWPHISVEAAFK